MPVVKIVVVEGNQRTPRLAGATIVRLVAITTQILVLEHEEHVPFQSLTHEVDETRRHVSVDVDPRPITQAIHERCQLGLQAAHAMWRARPPGAERSREPQRCRSTQGTVFGRRRALPSGAGLPFQVGEKRVAPMY